MFVVVVVAGRMAAQYTIRWRRKAKGGNGKATKENTAVTRKRQYMVRRQLAGQ
jgi:hypothetical protein